MSECWSASADEYSIGTTYQMALEATIEAAEHGAPEVEIYRWEGIDIGERWLPDVEAILTALDEQHEAVAEEVDDDTAAIEVAARELGKAIRKHYRETRFRLVETRYVMLGWDGVGDGDWPEVL